MTNIQTNKPSYPFGMPKTPFNPRTGQHLPLSDPRVVEVFTVSEEQADVLICRDTRGNLRMVAKPYALQKSPFDGETIDGILYTYSATVGERTAGSTTEYITPSYQVGEQIIASKSPMEVALYATDGHESDTTAKCDWTDLNNAGRTWLIEGAEASKITIVNASGMTIPAYGVCKITSISGNSATVIRPDADALSPGMCVVNGATEILPGESGEGWTPYESSAQVIALTTGTPAAGDDLGTASGSFVLTTAQTGFICVYPAPAGGQAHVRPFA